jgi:hypothetical protein
MLFPEVTSKLQLFIVVISVEIELVVKKTAHGN